MTKTKTLLLTVVLAVLAIMQGWAQKPFTFAQITDIHLNSNDPKPLEYLMTSIADINQNPDIDFVLVTGDLADNGDNASLEQLDSALKTLNKKYYVVTGNHETTWSESGMAKFSELFGSERLEFEHNGVLFLGFTTGPFIKMALGHVAPHDLTWLAEEVNNKGKGKQVFLVTHYPITKGDIDNWSEATDAIRKLNVKVFIGGHYHRNRALFYDGIPGFLSRSNLKDGNGKTGYSLCHVTADSLTIAEKNPGEAPRQWGGISLKKQYYDPQGHADEYPDFSSNATYASKVGEVWRIKSGRSIYASATCWKDRVFVGDVTGLMTAYDKATGKECWHFQADKKIVGTPAVVSGTLVFGSTGDLIYGLDARTGRELWQIKTDLPIMGAVASDGKTAYIGGSDHKMHAIDARTGKERWTFDGVKGYIVTRPLLTQGMVVFGAWDSKLYALNQQDGSLLWTWNHPKGGLHYSPAQVWPVANKEAIFIADPQRALTAIGLKDGKTLWRTFQSKVRESIGMSADGQRIYAKTMQDSIVCYRATASEVKEVWATDCGFGYEHASTMLPEVNGTVYSSTKDGLIVALDNKTGRLKWTYKVGASLVNTVTPAGKRHIITTSTDGDIVMLEDKR
ncbi:MAG: PQQ-binding-like beta-propeller repeat protein [Prevotella sp.]|nr:PQQ-binding-like beta-propeller repeat protein [Prevotella sp.]